MARPRVNPKMMLPETACTNCGSADLGFGFSDAPGTRGSAFIQGCNTCSETTWTGTFEELMFILSNWYNVPIPVLE